MYRVDVEVQKASNTVWNSCPTLCRRGCHLTYPLLLGNERGVHERPNLAVGIEDHVDVHVDIGLAGQREPDWSVMPPVLGDYFTADISSPDLNLLAQLKHLGLYLLDYVDT
jgi:hypothetical protein